MAEKCKLPSVVGAAFHEACVVPDAWRHRRVPAAHAWSAAETLR